MCLCVWVYMYVKAQAIHASVLAQGSHFLPVRTWASNFIFLSHLHPFHFPKKDLFVEPFHAKCSAG